LILAVNDVYRIEGVEAGTTGGIARLRTLRRELEREHPDLLVLHAGDLLFPSLLSRTFNGEQMIDTLNDLDGDPGAFDERMFVVFGNHEFDLVQRSQAGILDRRVEQSQFRWVNGNVVFAAGDDGQPLVAAANLARRWIVESGGIRIGIFGLTIDSRRPEYAREFLDPLATARELTAELRREGAEVVVALTHLNARDDRRLLATLGSDGPDLVVGGHEHEHLACEVGGRLVLKADADARTASVIELTLGSDGKLATAHRLEPLSGAVAEDCGVRGKVDAWLARHEGFFCGQQPAGTPPNAGSLDPRCLGEVLGRSETRLEAEESKIRGSETNLGDWVADRMVEAFAPCGAQVAFVNSGSLRLNQDIPAGAITRRTVEELFAYPAPMYLLRIDGRTLERVAAHAIEGWPGAGNWLQISGFSFTHDTAGRAITGVELETAAGRRPLRPDEEILAVTLNYLFDTGGDRDGYTMLDPSLVVRNCPVNGKDLKGEVVIPALRASRAASGGAIAPQAVGRIRQLAAGKDGEVADPCAGQ
jgi:2',3'-cyclic-nucleotide 2'-phosphodiesterase (5'-nucleotidase family)